MKNYVKLKYRTRVWQILAPILRESNEIKFWFCYFTDLSSDFSIWKPPVSINVSNFYANIGFFNVTLNVFWFTSTSSTSFPKCSCNSSPSVSRAFSKEEVRAVTSTFFSWRVHWMRMPLPPVYHWPVKAHSKANERKWRKPLKRVVHSLCYKYVMNRLKRR